MIAEKKTKCRKLVEQLTLEEKIGMIHGAQLFETAGVPRLNIPPLRCSDGPMGVRQEFLPDSWETKNLGDDYVTYLPSGSALASTWNIGLAHKLGSVLGEETRGRGKDVILAPSVNIKRSPLCGRNFEYFSEDPYLTGELAVEYIQGVQQWDVAACVKHFAANNQESNRLWVDVDVEEEVLREIYLPAFYEAVTRGNSYTLMGAYNKIYGEHCCQSKKLLDDILRKEWGYKGVVISDWGAVHDTVLAANSQLDIEMSVTSDFDDYYMANPLKEKVLSGEIDESAIDEKVQRILELMETLHMFDDSRKQGVYNTKEHRQDTLEIARESIVLLKNDNNRLPLHPEKLGSVLVIGDNATRIHSCGGGSAEIKALYEISPLMGIKMHLGGAVQVDYVKGYEAEETGSQDGNWQEKSLEAGGGTISESETVSSIVELQRKRLREEAVTLASNYETVLFVGGLNHDQDSEGNDRLDMKLPYEQDRLIQELLAVRPDMVVVMVAGSSVEMGQWIDESQAVVWNFYNGMESGNALAEVLFGTTNPSGKLPETFYKSHLDCSAHAVGEFPGGDTVSYKEGHLVGYRYQDAFDIEPQFCFGHGLSYTSFEYSELTVEVERKNIGCKVKNVGEYEGKEVVQLYVKEPTSNVVKKLVGFEKVALDIGEEIKVEFSVECWEVGTVYYIGSSSHNLRLQVEI